MSKKENKHPYITGTEHGNLSFGKVNTRTNEISACMLQNGPDGGRHYIKMEETGNKEEGTKGSTKIFCPGALTAIAGKDIVNYGEGDDTPRDIPAIFYQAENGDIILSAPHGKIKLQAETIELIAEGSDNKKGIISLTSDEKVIIDSQIVDIQSKVSTKIFSEKTVDMIGRGLLNIYGGLCDFADRSTKNLPSKTGGEELSSNEGINR
jgi:hypothetical protein